METIFGDHIPTANDWLMLISGEIRSDHKAFRDVENWELCNGELNVVYKSGRDETYEFLMTCTGGGVALV